jgi:hypothetical protein
MLPLCGELNMIGARHVVGSMISNGGEKSLWRGLAHG